MKRILITGMSGTGKSALIAELASRGYRAVDADCDEYSEWVDVSGNPDDLGGPVEPGRDWVWREDRIWEFLSDQHTDILFLAGCAINMGKFLPQFDDVVLLSAPPEIILDRLAARTSNAYGRRPEQAARVLSLIETVEPLLRKISGHEIETRIPIQAVANAVLHITAG